MERVIISKFNTLHGRSTRPGVAPGAHNKIMNIDSATLRELSQHSFSWRFYEKKM